MKKLEVVIAIITNHQGRLLFQHRKKQPYRGYLGLVGGKIEAGESQEAALSREVQEETGLVISEPRFLGTIVETLQTTFDETAVSLHVFSVKTTGCLQANENEGDLLWVEKNDFFREKGKYIPTDWLIVQSLLGQNNFITQLVVINKGNVYEIQSTSYL